MFCDKVKIYIKAGDGGDGLVSFRRERFIGRGGPDGGDGGSGGSIFLKADPQISTLSSFNRLKKIIVSSGKRGGKKKKRGKSGKDLIFPIPCGTSIYDDRSGELVYDLIEKDEKICVARGGKGGFGNAHFATSRSQAPQMAELGEPGEERWLRLELKLVADVGIIGIPNCGKSTLLSRVSNARPKIASYPFTTLVPNLGVVNIDDFSFVACDIPGLLDGAYRGKGLGDEFLRHVERCRILIHLLDLTRDNLKKDYQKINQELKLFNPLLASKPQILAVNKIDVYGKPFDSAQGGNWKEEVKKRWTDKTPSIKEKPLFISAVTGEGVDKLLYKVVKKLKKLPKKPFIREKIKVFQPHKELLRNFEIIQGEDGFVVSGKKIEKIASQTDIKNPEAEARLYRAMDKIELESKLKEAGIQKGNRIRIGRRVARWQDDQIVFVG